jgi:DNA-3-methyladenine glycosylase II
MGLSATAIKSGLDAVAAQEPGFASALERAGYPEPRIRPTGYGTLMRTIVGQQVSVAAAASMWNKFEAHLGPDLAPEKVLASDFDQLRACGLSRQKQGYMRSLCELVVSGELDFTSLPKDDEEAIARLTQIAEGRPDIWPAGDLAVQAGLHKLLGLPERPSEKATRDMAEKWRPHRGATAIFTWHCYNNPAL